MALTVSNIAGTNSTTSSATLTTGATVTAAVGDWLYAACSADNAGASGAVSISGISDSAGNTWILRNAYINQDPGAASAGITLAQWTCQVTNALSSGTVTVSFSPNTVSKAVLVQRVQPSASELVAFVSAGAGAVGSATTMSAGAVSVTNGHTIFGATATEDIAVAPADTDTTNGNWSTAYTITANTGTIATGAALTTQYKTVNATGNQSYNTSTAAARDFAINYLILRTIPKVLSGTATLVAESSTSSGNGTSSSTGVGDLAEIESATVAGTGTAGFDAVTGAGGLTAESSTVAGVGPSISTATGAIAGTETGIDAFAAAGFVVSSGAIAGTETGIDAFAAAGAVQVSGSLSAVEIGTDTFSASGITERIGILAATELGFDTLASSGIVLVSGSCNVTESGTDIFYGVFFEAYPLAGVGQSYPLTVSQSYPLDGFAQIYPITGSQVYPLAGIKQTYPLEAAA